MDIKCMIVATHNMDKLREIHEIMPDIALITTRDLHYNEEIIEDGQTFEENALIKARAIWKKFGGCVMADDSGLVIDYIGGEPGIYSARYMGEHTSYAVKNAALIARLNEAKGEERSARFYAAIACILPDGYEIVVNGTMEGLIAMEPAGENGFGYDPILFLPQYNMTSAELSREEKNKISHRGEALHALRAVLKEL